MHYIYVFWNDYPTFTFNVAFLSHHYELTVLRIEPNSQLLTKHLLRSACAQMLAKVQDGNAIIA